MDLPFVRPQSMIYGSRTKQTRGESVEHDAKFIVDSTRVKPCDPRGEIVRLWDELNEDERELLIPRLLYTTRLGERVRETGLAWRPAYIDRGGVY